MPKYWIKELPTWGDSPFRWDDAKAVNAGGAAAGFVYIGNDPEYPENTFAAIWTNGGPPNVLEAAAWYSVAYGINDGGDVVGQEYNVHPYRAFFYRAETGEVLNLAPLIGSDESVAFSVNNQGVAVGVADNLVTARPFIFDSNGGPVKLLDPLPGDTSAGASGINELDHVVGMSGDSVFIYRDGNMDGLGGAGLVTEVNGVNDSDVITGTRHVSGPPIWPSLFQAFRLDASAATPTFEPIGHSQAPGYLNSSGCAINNHGDVVGFSADQNGNSRPFIDIPDGPEAGFYDLQDHLIGGDGWTLEDAEGISNTGYIVGRGVYQGQVRAYLLTPWSPGRPPSPLGHYDKPIIDAVMGFLFLFGGATKDGPGIGIPPGGGHIHIDPHSPALFLHNWQRMSPAQRDLYIGMAIRNLNQLLANPELAELTRRTGTEIIESAISEFKGEQR